MNAFSAFVRKETQHILRDKRTLLVAIVIPVVQLLLFGFAISTDVTEIDFAVVAPEMSQPVRKQIARLESNSLFDFKGYVDESEVEGLLKRNEVMAVVIFDRNYNLGEEAGGIRVVADASNTNTAQASANYLMQALTNGGGERGAFGGGERGLSAGGGAAMPNVTVLYNPLLLSSYNFVPGIMGMIFLLICAMLTSVSIVREKETGTMEVLLVSPVSPGMIVIAKMVPYLVLSCIDLAIILLLSRFALDACLLADGCTADFRNGAYCACHHVVGDAVPDREHARRFAVVLGDSAGPVVYQRHAQADDTGIGIRCRADRDGCADRHDGGVSDDFGETV